MVLNAGNIAILGDTGRGKTFIACRALLEFIKANCLKRDMFDFDSPLGLYVNYPDLLAYARDGVIDTDAMEIYYNVPLLLLDDVGADRGTKFASDILYLIINNRLSNCRSTLYTSNLSSNNMADVLGKRIASRIIGESKAISLVGSEDTRHV
jgi:DNA replication protein DnaC